MFVRTKLIVLSVAFRVYGLFRSKTVSSGVNLFHFIDSPPKYRSDITISGDCNPFSLHDYLSSLWDPHNSVCLEFGILTIQSVQFSGYSLN